MTNNTTEIDGLNIREKLVHIDQMLADIDRTFADRDRKRQEIQFAPWQVFATLLIAAAAFFTAGVAFTKLFG
jgi:hypothetical protein